jgi:tetratricopeptide (TPR) repeat protein
MSIVNEALKKASKAKNKKEKRKFPRQELGVLTFASRHWKRPLIYGGTAVAVLFFGLLSWWIFKGTSDSPKNQALPAGQMHIPTQNAVLTPDASVLQSQATRIFDHYQKGLAHYREKKFNEAEQEFLAILAQDPNQAVAHNNLGLVYHAQGKEKQAVLEYLSAMKIDPNSAETMNNLGLLYDQQGRAEEAVGLYDRALKIKPGYSEAHLNYAIILERMGYLEEAKRHYQSFLSKPPTDLGDVVMTVQSRLPHLP